MRLESCKIIKNPYFMRGEAPCRPQDHFESDASAIPPLLRFLNESYINILEKNMQVFFEYNYYYTFTFDFINFIFLSVVQHILYSSNIHFSSYNRNILHCTTVNFFIFPYIAYIISKTYGYYLK